MEEQIEQDDLCPICHLLFYKPVTTTCGHNMCSSCLNHWAEVSVAETFQEVPLDDKPKPFSPAEIEVGCPMCRTTTRANFNMELASSLKLKYPQTNEKREEEEESEMQADDVITMTVYVGNTHIYKPTRSNDADTENAHEWTFFVRPERTDIIDEIRILLHPTFDPPMTVKRRAPYEIRRIGWGTFRITAVTVLKAGYEWVSSDAEKDERTGKSLLNIEWPLTFEGDGGQGRARMKIRRKRLARQRTQ